MGRQDNVATFNLAPVYSKFNVFCKKAEIDYDDSSEFTITAESTVVSDDEDNDDVPPPRTQRRSI
eukprot:scaffold10971_cov69-Cylindrotheca_fusiformis.AAC.1